jgi:uncharacterized membrane protein YhaH (DUF805 family)
MASIIISYRRADTGHITGRIFDHLVDHFGRDSVFMDIDAIPIGMDFREHIRTALDKCDIMLAIVGPRWQDGGSPRDRLADETDWMRIELETALAKKIPVVPVLIDQSQLPSPSELPESLRDLTFRQTTRIDSGVDFSVHMERLIRSIDKLIARTHMAAPGSAAREVTAVRPAGEARGSEAPAAERPTRQANATKPFDEVWALFSTSGRTNRPTWWMVTAVSFVYCGAAAEILARHREFAWYAASLIPAAAMIFAASARRSHDRGRNAWWALPSIGLALFLGWAHLWLQLGDVGTTGSFMSVVAIGSCVFGVWAIVEFGFLKGDAAPNRYGPDVRDPAGAQGIVSPGATTPSRSTLLIASGVALILVIGTALTRIAPFAGPSATDTPAVPAPAPAAGSDSMWARIAAAPLQSEVRAAYERARSASAAATHAAYSAREAKARARLAVLEAARHTAGYSQIDDNDTDEPRSFAGAVRNGVPDGYGTIRWRSSGRTYSGQFQRGELVGAGVFTRGATTYEGEFRQNKPSGVGVLSLDAADANGGRYAGDFANGVPDGYGLRTYQPGRVFFGQWRGGKRDGYGALFDADGNLIEQGVYRADALVQPMTGNDR